MPLINQIDLTSTQIKPKLSIHKPDKTMVGYIPEAFDISLELKLGGIHTLTFSVPFKIEQNHRLILNPNINKLKYRYLIKMTLGNYFDYFVINKPIKISEEDGDTKTLECFSLGFELSSKKLRGYTAISKNPTEVLTEILEGTGWSIGTVSDSIDSQYRSFEPGGNPMVLDFILTDMADSYGAIAFFDSDNREVSLYKSDEIGINKGLKFNYGKYIDSLTDELDPTEFATRLYPIGKDGLTINEANPTGQSYLMDYSYFMYPFAKTDGVITSHSDYMSDSLCAALLDYNSLLATKDGKSLQCSTGTTTTTVIAPGHSLLTGDYIINRNRDNAIRKITVVDINTFTVDEITGQQCGDKLIAYTDGTYRKLLFSKWDKNTTLTVKENELSALQQEKTLILDRIAVQQDEQNITTKTVNYTGSSQNVTASLSNILEYVVMCKISSITDITIKLDGSTKTLTADEWTVLGKRESSSSTTVNISGSGSATVKVVVCAITSDEYSESDNENELIDKYCLDNKESEIASKQAEIDAIEDEIALINAGITTLQTEISLSSNFTSSQLEELAQYTIDKDWEDQNYFDVIDLYEDAKDKFSEMNNPNTIIQLDIADFLMDLEIPNFEKAKLVLGDEVLVYHETLGTDVTANIIEVKFTFSSYNDANSIELTIANVKTVLSDNDKIIKALYKSIHTTDKLNSKQSQWNSIATNFDNRNDRITTIPANPVLPDTPVSFDENTDGSVNLSFAWQFNGVDNAYNIDGFFVYIRSLDNDEPYTFGSSISKEQISNINPSKRAFELQGVPANIYYTFGVQAYRKVDSDISSTGMLVSNIIQSNPFRPKDSVSYRGTLDGTPVSDIVDATSNFNNRNDRNSTTPATPYVANDGTSIDHSLNTDGSVDISFEWEFNGTGQAYDIDGFVVFIRSSDSASSYNFGTTPVEEQVFFLDSEKRSMILYGVSANRYYTFGVRSYRNVDNDISVNGILQSSIVKATGIGENPYQPSSTVAFSGDVTGTVKDKFGNTIAGQEGLALENLVGFGIESGGVITVDSINIPNVAKSQILSWNETNKTITVSDATAFPIASNACFTCDLAAGNTAFYFKYTSRDSTTFYGVSAVESSQETLLWWYLNNYLRPNSSVYIWPTCNANISVSESYSINENGIRIYTPSRIWTQYDLTVSPYDYNGWKLYGIYISSSGSYEIFKEDTSAHSYPNTVLPEGSVKVGYLIAGYGIEEPNGELQLKKDFDNDGVPIPKIIIKHDIRYRQERLLRTEDGALATNLVEYGTQFESTIVAPKSYNTIYIPLGPGKKMCDLSITYNTNKLDADNLTQGAKFTVGRRPAAGTDYGIKIVWGIYVDSAGKAYHVDQKRNNGTFDYIIPPSALNVSYTYIYDMDLMPYPSDPSKICLKVVFFNNSSSISETLNMRYNWCAS